MEHSPAEMERTTVVLNGGYDLDFVDQPPDDLLCLICIMLAKDPIQVCHSAGLMMYHTNSPVSDNYGLYKSKLSYLVWEI